MYTRKFLSVIVPAYNVEQYIEKCLNSIIYSKSEKVEIIIIDDGSKDSTGKICDNYAKEYEDIKVLHVENGGLSKARNIGIKEAQGEYLLFLDSDDFLSKNALTNIINELEQRKVDVLIGLYNNYYINSDETESCDYQLDIESINGCTGEKLISILLSLGTYDWYAWLNIVNREFLIKNNLYFKEGYYFEDVIWTPQVLYYAESVSGMNFHFYNYTRNRGGSITTKITDRAYSDKLYACNFIKTFVENNNFSEENKKKMLGNINRLYVALLADSWCINKKKRIEYWEQLKQYKSILKLSHRKYMQILYILWKIIGIRGVSFVLYMRAEWVRNKKVLCMWKEKNKSEKYKMG